MKKIDTIIALIVGEITALYFVNLLKDVGAKNQIVGSVLWYLPVAFPILAVIGLWLAYFIGKKFLFVFQLAKFLLIGAMATIFDLGALGLFIKYTGANAGLNYAIFKGISFIIATIAKYFADKFWAFKKTQTAGMGGEFSKFFLVTIVGLGINVGAASFVVNQIGPQMGITPETWANIGGIAAVFITFLWNFIGYKYIVFKV